MTSLRTRLALGLALPMVLAAPAMAQISNGMPLVTGSDGGKPVIQYGPGETGSISNGVAIITGFQRGGKPIITYGEGATPGPNNGVANLRGNEDGGARNQPGPGASGSFADGGIPVYVPGGGGHVIYQEPAEPGPVPVAAAVAPSPSLMRGSRALPADASAAIRQARQDLTQRRAGAADTALEQAETALLNDRHDGTTGWRQSLAAVTTARQDLARRDAGAAQQALGGLRIGA